ncbi:MAPEG family protein [Marinobacter arenosus]|uniref:MAPEG family protein n=1 Tax=Marinobacter arenosus TaxID=2856822 RepID=UPI001C4BC59E|nr:MAPEG family protein [Marinobacter arenosus]MBW0147125.1 MAPEG family protein [Marinobacter arenosus]
MSTSAQVLGLFISWALLLVVLMEASRCYFLIKGRIRSNEFKPDNSNLPPFMQRLARAHANCIEGLPVFGGLLILALVTDQTEITDALAPWFLLARVAQSSIHVASLSVVAVNARFATFVVQVGIALYWAWALVLS